MNLGFGNFMLGFWFVSYLDNHLIVFFSFVLGSILNLQQQRLQQPIHHEVILHYDLGYQHYYCHLLPSFECFEGSRFTLHLFILVLA